MPSAASATWPAYFSVASLYARGHAMRCGATTVMGNPRRMHPSSPGETRSVTLSMFWSVMRSPGTTSAATIAGSKRARRTAPTTSGPLVARVHQRRDREPVVGDPRLLALVEVPALLAREAMARQRCLRGVLELHVHHHDRRRETHLVLVL